MSLRHVDLPRSVAERAAIGKAARRTLPRKDFADWTPATNRPDPVALLAGQETSRIPQLLPLRHQRMSVNEFAFYRGTAIVMANDLGVLPNTGLTVQLCGDAHMSNFGLFGAPDRSVVFDVNDFDETQPGPFEWDVQRLAVSAFLAGSSNGFTEDVNVSAVEAAVKGYRYGMNLYSQMTDLDIWYNRVDVLQLAEIAKSTGDKSGSKAMIKAVNKARSRNAWSAIVKLTEVRDGRRVFRNDPPIITRLAPDSVLTQRAIQMFSDYVGTLQEDRRHLVEQYRIADIGHKVVGVGSVGLIALVVLLQGRDDNDLLALQVKQAQQSVLEPFTAPSEYPQHGQRVVAGQRIMQAASDVFLGWVAGQFSRQYYVRQLRDMKWSPDLTSMKQEGLVKYAALCGAALARSHARSGDPVAINAYVGSGKAFVAGMVEFSRRYAAQVAKDFAEFNHALDEGKLAKTSVSEEASQASAAVRDFLEMGASLNNS